MTRKEKQEKNQIRAAEIKNLVKAAMIIDIYLYERQNNNKSSSIKNYRNYELDVTVTKSVSYYRAGCSIKHTYQKGKDRLVVPYYFYFDMECTYKTINHIRNQESTRSLAKYKLDQEAIVQRMPTEEEISWAKSVIRNSGIDISELHIDETPYAIKFRGLVPAETFRSQLWFKSKEDAEAFQKDLLDNPKKLFNFLRESDIIVAEGTEDVAKKLKSIESLPVEVCY